MKVDMPHFDVVKDVKNDLRGELSIRLASVPEFRIHPSVTFGLNEVARGLAKLFPHRRSIAYFQGCSPYFDPLVTYFSSEGYSLQVFPFEKLKSTDWVETLKKDTLFVLFSEDDALTAQTFEVEAFQKTLEAKRIFTVSVSHTLHLYRASWAIAPYWARVFSGGTKLSVSLLGERAAKLESLLFGPADWALSLKDETAKTFASRAEAQNLIEEFERKNIADAKAFFPKGAGRVFDRAAIYWEDMDGEALIHELASLLNMDLLVPGQEARLETASLCRWKGLRTLNWLGEQGVSSPISRGLVLISKELLTPNLEKALKKARENVLRLQNGPA